MAWKPVFGIHPVIAPLTALEVLEDQMRGAEIALGVVSKYPDQDSETRASIKKLTALRDGYKRDIDRLTT